MSSADHVQHHVPNDGDLYAENELTLMDMVLLLWRRRYLIAGFTGAFACVIALFALLSVFRAPSQSETSLRFRLTFVGADQGMYPNGLTFSINDIDAPSILDAAYASSGASQYVDRAAFRDAISVMKSSDGLMFIERKYSSLLDPNSRLSPGERDRYREEYEAAREKFFAQADHEIVFTSTSAMAIPPSVRSSAVHDVLKEWARFSQDRRGVQVYPVAIVAGDIFDDIEREGQEPLIQLDKLRSAAQKITAVARQISELPGALLIQTPAGANIESTRFRLASLWQYEVQPLLGMIRSKGLYRDLPQVQAYLEEQVYTLEMDEQRQKGVLELVENALETYRDQRMPALTRGETGGLPGTGLSGGTLIPQIGDSFLDRLIAMANETQDANYRQEATDRIIREGTALLEIQKNIAFYKDLLPKVESDVTTTSGIGFQERLTEFHAQFQEALAQAKNLNATCIEIRDIVSDRNLQGEQLLYSVVGPPVVAKATTVSVKRIGVFSAVAVFVFFWLVAFIVLAMERAANRQFITHSAA